MRGGADDSQITKEESYALEESEQQVEDKDEDDEIENSAMIKGTKKRAKAGARGGKGKEGTCTSTEAPTAKGKEKRKI